MIDQLLGRTRVTATTIRRTENHRKLITEIQKRDLSYSDMAKLLFMTKEAARKYAHELVAAKIIIAEYSGPPPLPRVTYKFAGDAGRAAAFIFELERPARELARRRAERDATGYQEPRLVRHIPACDQMLAALYGTGPSDRGTA
jgi:predicted ArsR family transcriptional regulator